MAIISDFQDPIEKSTKNFYSKGENSMSLYCTHPREKKKKEGKDTYCLYAFFILTIKSCAYAKKYVINYFIIVFVLGAIFFLFSNISGLLFPDPFHI